MQGMTKFKSVTTAEPPKPMTHEYNHLETAFLETIH